MPYQPTAVPHRTPPGLKEWLARQFRLIANELSAPRAQLLTLDQLSESPARPVDGMLVYADGSNWDPGSGEGFYGRENGSWVKL